MADVVKKLSQAVFPDQRKYCLSFFSANKIAHHGVNARRVAPGRNGQYQINVANEI